MNETHATCRQAGPIGSLEATTSAIKDSLERIEKGQDRFIQVLETIASQGTKIDKAETDIEGLYDRVRKIELTAVEQGTRIGIASGIVAAVIAAVIAYVGK